MHCVFCEGEGGTVLWRDALCRIVHAPTEGYPAFLRVIVNHHVREMTDLDADAQQQLMRAVFAAESALRECVQPDKVNLASFGNQVPHVHWHVIARFADDPHFPDPAWGAPRRTGAARATIDEAALRVRLAALLR